MVISVAVTCKNKKEAAEIAKALLKKKLVACANIIDGIDSIYWWQEKILKAKEALLILKSLENKVKEVVSEIKKLHSYEVPVIEIWKVEVSREAEKWLIEGLK